MASRIRLVRFFGGFVCGVTVSTGACIAAVKLYMPEHRPEEHVHEKVSAAQRLIELYGLPLTGAETRSYTNHILSYDQTRRTPKWVAEHLSNEKLLGKNQWQRHFISRISSHRIMKIIQASGTDIYFLLPRLEMYCRELTERFSDVWVISGPLTLPQVYQDGKKMVSYQLIGKDDVAVPTHLYKVILVRKDPSAEPLALGAFIVPNAPISFEHHLKEYQVSLTDLQRMSGLTFFPKIEKAEGLKNLCLVDSCELMDFKRFTLYITSRKVVSAKTLAKLEKMMSDLEEAGITPDNYLAKLYHEKKQELLKKESPQNQVG
ncbi:hypothetical protein P4O66_010121 [Electrophorus voltai]|uniref:Uncharacterized protein n=1 Tax=Electrophorus voltai TaxID=2609070 RepID=A0AAD9DW29_9TELE|nr:hypothetical protein P4O66_010121 [Electrophorus voltai]